MGFNSAFKGLKVKCFHTHTNYIYLMLSVVVKTAAVKTAFLVQSHRIT